MPRGDCFVAKPPRNDESPALTVFASRPSGGRGNPLSEPTLDAEGGDCFVAKPPRNDESPALTVFASPRRFGAMRARHDCHAVTEAQSSDARIGRSHQTGASFV